MKIVFTGDSITDSGRNREDGKSLGSGYVKILADKLRPIYPDTDIELVNRARTDMRYTTCWKTCSATCWICTPTSP